MGNVIDYQKILNWFRGILFSRKANWWSVVVLIVCAVFVICYWRFNAPKPTTEQRIEGSPGATQQQAGGNIYNTINNTTIATANPLEYREPSPQVMEQVKVKLLSLKTKHPNLDVWIRCEQGDQRRAVSVNIGKVLQSLGAGCYKDDFFMTGQIKTRIRGGLGHEVAGALSPYVQSSNFNFESLPDTEPTERVIIHFAGTPKFTESTVTFEEH